MRIGNEKHEKILSETINQLQDEGYKVINLDGKSPTCIAFKNNKTTAISILGRKRNLSGKWKRTKTITELENHYHMFDNIVRILYDSNNQERMDIIDKVIKKYKKNGYSIIYLKNKCPDAVAFHSKGIFAVEVIGVRQGYNSKFHIQQKEDVYDMFDGLMVKTFIYETDDVFTETFGRNLH